MINNRYDESRVIYLQSYWRGCIQRRIIVKKLMERRDKVKERFQLADLLDSVVVIQRAIRKFRAMAAARKQVEERRCALLQRAFEQREDHVTCPLPNSNSVNEIFSCMADVPDDLLKFSIPPREVEIQTLFDHIAFRPRIGVGCSGAVSPVNSAVVADSHEAPIPRVPERLLRELFFMCGGEGAQMPGEGTHAACRRHLVYVLQQEGAAIPPDHVDINFHQGQFGRYILLLQRM